MKHISQISIYQLLEFCQIEKKELEYATIYFLDNSNLIRYRDASSNQSEFISARTFQNVNKYELISQLFGFASLSEIESNIKNSRVHNKDLDTKTLKKNEVIGKYLQLKSSTLDLNVDTFYSAFLNQHVTLLFDNKQITNLYLLHPDKFISLYNSNPGYNTKGFNHSILQISSNPYDIESEDFLLTNNVGYYFEKLNQRTIEIPKEISNETVFSLFQLILKAYFNDELLNTRLSFDKIIYDLRTDDLRKMNQLNNKINLEIRNLLSFDQDQTDDLIEEVISKYYSLNYSRNQNIFTYSMHLSFGNLNRFFQSLSTVIGAKDITLKI